MTGKDYVAVVVLSNKDGAVVANVGETCERVNRGSLGWLAEQGLIVPKPREAVDEKEGD